jgi:enterobactin synthetase component D
MNPNAGWLQLVAQRSVPHGELVAVALLAGSAGGAEDAARSDRALLPSESMLAEARAQLHPEEWVLAEALAPPRRLAFIGGRMAMRTVLTSIAPAHRHWPLLRTARGAPRLPAGVIGSISHKRQLAVALAARATAEARTMGVDVEEVPDARDLTRPDLAPRILTAGEQRALAPLAARDPLAYREAVRLRFALKEAVYKAIDPHVQRYVGFQEVEVFPEDAGAVEVRLALPELAGRQLTVQGYWTRVAGHLVATAVGTRHAP